MVLKFWYYGNNDEPIIKKFIKLDRNGMQTVYPLYMVDLSDDTAYPIYTENYDAIKLLLRKLKINKINNTKMTFEQEFISFYLDNYEHIDIQYVHHD